MHVRRRGMRTARSSFPRRCCLNYPPTGAERGSRCPARIGWMQRNLFAGPYLDRAAHLRDDPDWFATALADDRSRVVPVWNLRNLIADGPTPHAAFLELGDLEA